MKTLLYGLLMLAVATCAPGAASAADLGGYYERESYVERPARIIERERVIVERHHYYEPRYIEEPVVTHYRPRRVYYYATYPHRFHDRHRYHRHHYRRHDRHHHRYHDYGRRW